MAMSPMDFVAAAKAHIKEVDREEAKQMIAAGARVLDVREPAEFEAGHLKGAVSIPRGVLEFKIGSHPAMAETAGPVVCYCKTGGRSALAALTLNQMGYTHVVSLAGGFDGWEAAGEGFEKNPEVC